MSDSETSRSAHAGGRMNTAKRHSIPVANEAAEHQNRNHRIEFSVSCFRCTVHPSNLSSK